jgi:hypothetical protein
MKNHPLTCEGLGKPGGGLVLMDLARSNVQDKQMFFSQTPQVWNIFFPYNVAFFECDSLELTGSDFCNIMGKNLSNGLVNREGAC